MFFFEQKQQQGHTQEDEHDSFMVFLNTLESLCVCVCVCFFFPVPKDSL